MDDIIIIHDDKKFLKQLLWEMTEHVEERLRLEFNSKTQITTIPSGIEYLGFRYYLTDTGRVIRRLKRSSRRRMFRRIKSITLMSTSCPPYVHLMSTPCPFSYENRCDIITIENEWGTQKHLRNFQNSIAVCRQADRFYFTLESGGVRTGLRGIFMPTFQ